MTILINSSETLIEDDEGRKDQLYPDSLGFLTIGVGHMIDPKRNGRLPDPIITALRDYDVAVARDAAARLRGYFVLNTPRKAVVESMVFNLGLPRLMGFTRFLDALNKGDYLGASHEMLDSAWHAQLPKRVERLARIMVVGDWP